MRNLIRISGFALLAVTTAVPAQSQTIETSFDEAANIRDRAEFLRFAPQEATSSTKIDYQHWDEALEYFVFRMGRSIREAAPSVTPETGTRQIHGHDSRYRLEGNRIIFSYLEPEMISALTAYREDLERTAGLVDMPSLPRNEQLAFWLNLHNAAIIEQIALAYPVSQPSRIKFADGRIGVDHERFITVAGVRMSPHDIRTKIVYPNWKDPRVIYGFFRGDIGGPSIQGEAFTSDNVAKLLGDGAREFVNSLRGTQRRGSALRVSKIYEEARPFYFADFGDDFRSHLSEFGSDQVKEIVTNTRSVRANLYEADISDLMKGETSPIYSPMNTGSGEDLRMNGKNLSPSGGSAQPTRFPPALVRLLGEHNSKYQKIIKRRDLLGRVILLTPEELEAEKPAEIVN